jgi:aerobic-type carbon monoxide dehydrogenase small subunit (CoxS/CutS family)
MTVKALMAENPDPSDEDVRAALSSNLCRCTGYNQMYLAIKSAIAEERKGMAVMAGPKSHE